ncbi:hypothetical protein Tco_0616321 [Tanacetum coccineum]
MNNRCKPFRAAVDSHAHTDREQGSRRIPHCKSALKRDIIPFRQRRVKLSTEYMQRFPSPSGFLYRRCGTMKGQKSQAKNFRFDAARNLEILRDRDDYDRSERSDKRHKSGDRYHPYSQQGSHKSHGILVLDATRERGHKPSIYQHRRSHPGECSPCCMGDYAAFNWPACHLQRDCKEKNFCASSSGHADKKPDASRPCPLHLTQDQFLTGKSMKIISAFKSNVHYYRMAAEGIPPIRDVDLTLDLNPGLSLSPKHLIACTD